jgi:hypothetical protein
MNKQLTKLISKHKGKVLKFRHLPKEAKYAMAHYMSIDGEAWLYPAAIEVAAKNRANMAKAIVKSIRFYTKHYGNRRFGYVNIPTKEFLSLFLEKVRDEYCIKNKDLYEKRTKFWPVILDFSIINEEQVGPIQDGWHRFADYVTMGLKKIPCLYYIK